MEDGKAADWAFSKKGRFSAVVGERTHQLFRLLVGAMLTVSTSVVGSLLASSHWWPYKKLMSA
jgi:hypothetical protein